MGEKSGVDIPSGAGCLLAERAACFRLCAEIPQEGDGFDLRGFTRFATGWPSAEDQQGTDRRRGIWHHAYLTPTPSGMLTGVMAWDESRPALPSDPG